MSSVQCWPPSGSWGVVGPSKLVSVVNGLETFKIFVISKANTEFNVDSKMENNTCTMDIVGFLNAVFTVHFLKLGFNFSM